MFSGLSEEGTMTVPVKRFASPWVFWFALYDRDVGWRSRTQEVSNIATALKRTQALCKGCKNSLEPFSAVRWYTRY
jgi:hypothetical protein